MRKPFARWAVPASVEKRHNGRNTPKGVYGDAVKTVQIRVIKLL